MRNVKNLLLGGKRWIVSLIAVAALLVIGAGSGYAMASVSTTPAAASNLYGCVNGSTRALENVYTLPQNFQGCTNGFPITVASGKDGTTGPAGPAGVAGTNGTNGAPGATGPAGVKGDTGATGPSGVQAINTSKLTTTASVPTGGSFNSKALQVGSIDLKAGTYLINLSAQSEPSADTATGVQPQFFLYNQTKNSSFTGDLLNIGSGTLAPAGTNHDNYASGSAIVTLSSDTTLLVYGFGYDNDSGASDYSLIAGSINAVQLTPAS
jgi:Collagen triple helix repeat (20 copies)